MKFSNAEQVYQHAHCVFKWEPTNGAIEVERERHYKLGTGREVCMPLPWFITHSTNERRPKKQNPSPGEGGSHSWMHASFRVWFGLICLQCPISTSFPAFFPAFSSSPLFSKHVHARHNTTAYGTVQNLYFSDTALKHSLTFNILRWRHVTLWSNLSILLVFLHSVDHIHITYTTRDFFAASSSCCIAHKVFVNKPYVGFILLSR